MDRNNKFAIRVWGDYACFTDPRLKAEPSSLGVLSPSAAVGILESIYWKPNQIKYNVTKIHIMKPIQWHRVTQKYVKSPPTAAKRNPDRTLVTISYLKDVEYIIEFEIESLDGNFSKQHDILQRRLQRKESFDRICLGVNECPGQFEQVNLDSIPTAQQINCDFGMVPHVRILKPQKTKQKDLPEHKKLQHSGYILCSGVVTNGVLSVPKLSFC